MEGSLLMKYFYAIIKKNYTKCASTEGEEEGKSGDCEGERPNSDVVGGVEDGKKR